MRTLTFSLLITVFSATIGLGLLMSWAYNKYAAQHQQHELLAQEQLNAKIAHLIQTDTQPQTFINRWNATTGSKLTLEDDDALVLPSTLSTPFFNGEIIALESEEGVSFYTHLPAIHKNLIMDISLPNHSPQTTIQLVLTLLFYLGTALAITAWLLPLLKRLNLLNTMSQEFGQGDLSARMNHSAFSYIKNIEQGFNHMAERIEQLIADNKLLSRAVSHDLKTPLARLRFGLDTLEEEDNPDKRAAYHERINDDLDNMESLINTLLEYARLDDSQISLHRKAIELNEFLATSIRSFNHRNSGFITLQSDEHCVIKADPKYLGMIVQNLISNAVIYSQSTVLLSTKQKDGAVILTIEDDGEGVAEKDIQRILKPFQRGKESNAPKGHGMGLAICTRIIEWFDADLSVERSEKLGGAKFVVTFPAP